MEYFWGYFFIIVGFGSLIGLCVWMVRRFFTHGYLDELYERQKRSTPYALDVTFGKDFFIIFRKALSLFILISVTLSAIGLLYLAHIMFHD